MKNLTLITALAILAFSCGDAGLGFNVRKELPVSLPIEANDIPQPPFGSFDPPAFNESIDYSLEKVDAFSDDLDNIEAVLLNNISYAISGVETSEEISVQAMSFELSANGANIGTINVANRLGGVLKDLPKASISSLDSEALSELLLNGGSIDANVTFDFGELPPSSINFDFEFYFDVIVKVRDL